MEENDNLKRLPETEHKAESLVDTAHAERDRFLAATAALHFTGAVIGLQARERFARWPQAGGALIALAGVWMLS